MFMIMGVLGFLNGFVLFFVILFWVGFLFFFYVKKMNLKGVNFNVGYRVSFYYSGDMFMMVYNGSVVL